MGARARFILSGGLVETLCRESLRVVHASRAWGSITLMRSFWALGVVSLVLGWSAACGGDAATAPTSAGTGGSATGGQSAGGNPATTTSGPTTGGNSAGGNGTGGTPTSGAGGFGNSCEEACAKVDMCAGFAGACGLIGVDCNDPNAECPAACVNAADCAALTSLIGQNPDPTLSACLDMCDLGQGGAGGAGGSGGGGSQIACGICTGQNCSGAAQACQGVAACQAYAQCAANCSNPTCEQDCLANNPSAESTALSTCVCDNCSNQCASCP